MPLVPGARLGPYEILAALGAGGMGEVYRARDTRLDRVVAIKVISSFLATSPELRQRFEREAKTISQLNHPNICALYDIGHDGGTDYLVLEYVEGEALSARLGRGALPPSEALAIGIQVADALDRAHRQGIVHRDLKPGNIMLTKSGAKLLDFGLAKSGMASNAISGVLSTPLTATTPITAQGTILGTFQYMAPEQIEGAEADARSDIWAFGCVLYEMLTGRRAFEGKSHASLIGAILKDQPPPISTEQPLAPPALEQIVRRCLAKDPEDRWQTARDLVLQLKWVHEGSAAGLPVATARRSRVRERLAWAVGALGILAAAATVTWHVTTRTPAAMPVSFTVTSPEGASFGVVGQAAPFPAVSPNGRMLAFLAQRPGQPFYIWVRSLDSTVARELPGTGGAQFPFWSPDSRFLAFFADNKLKKIDLTGGSPQHLCDVRLPESGSWHSSGVILFARDRFEGLVTVPAAGGEPKLVLPVNVLGAGAFGPPTFLPDGRRFLFQRQGFVFLASLDGGAPKRLFPSASRAQYVAPGFVLHVRGESLFAQPFDGAKGEATGDPIPVASAVSVGQNGRAAFSASDNGVLVFRQATSASDAQLTWYSATGQELGPVGPPGPFGELALSPDNRRVAVQRRDGENADIWIIDLERNSASRLTFDPATDTHPLWLPDGRSIVFGSMREESGIYRKAASGVGADELLVRAEEPRPHAVTADGQMVLFDISADIWMARVGRVDSAKPLMANPAFSETQSRLSPDGRYVAYASNESGRVEVYVATFPDLAQRWPLTTNGGNAPLWSADGRKIYFMKGAGSGKPSLSVVDVRYEATDLRFSQPRHVVDLVARPVPDQYAIARDGRILVARALSAVPTIDPLAVVVNWPRAFGLR